MLDAELALDAEPALDVVPVLDAEPALVLDTEPVLDAEPVLDVVPVLDAVKVFNEENFREVNGGELMEEINEEADEEIELPSSDEDEFVIFSAATPSPAAEGRLAAPELLGHSSYLEGHVAAERSPWRGSTFFQGHNRQAEEARFSPDRERRRFEALKKEEALFQERLNGIVWTAIKLYGSQKNSGVIRRHGRSGKKRVEEFKEEYKQNSRSLNGSISLISRKINSIEGNGNPSSFRTILCRELAVFINRERLGDAPPAVGRAKEIDVALFSQSEYRRGDGYRKQVQEEVVAGLIELSRRFPVVTEGETARYAPI